jgi:hypothetical protein
MKEDLTGAGAKIRVGICHEMPQKKRPLCRRCCPMPFPVRSR